MPKLTQHIKTKIWQNSASQEEGTAALLLLDRLQWTKGPCLSPTNILHQSPAFGWKTFKELYVKEATHRRMISIELSEFGKAESADERSHFSAG